MQVLVAAADELYIGCESGSLFCGDFFMRNASEVAPLTSPLPGPRSMTALALHPTTQGPGHYAVATFVPGGIALFSTFAHQVIGVAST